MLKTSLVLVAVFVGYGSLLAGQATVIPTHAYAFGWSPAAGLLGVEFVARSFTAAPRLGGALGVGIGGIGARLDLTLRDPTTYNRIPYLALGYVVTPWIPTVKLSSATSIEAGVRFRRLARSGSISTSAVASRSCPDHQAS
jgi:hypothetical protein